VQWRRHHRRHARRVCASRNSATLSCAAARSLAINHQAKLVEQGVVWRVWGIERYIITLVTVSISNVIMHNVNKLARAGIFLLWPFDVIIPNSIDQFVSRYWAPNNNNTDMDPDPFFWEEASLMSILRYRYRLHDERTGVTDEYLGIGNTTSVPRGEERYNATVCFARRQAVMRRIGVREVGVRRQDARARCACMSKAQEDCWGWHG